MSEQIEQVLERKYDVGFYLEIELEMFESGLDELVICCILVMKNEFEWMFEWCLKFYYVWLEMEELDWVYVDYLKIDYQVIFYYLVLKSMKDKFKLLDEVDFELFCIYEKLGILLYEQEMLVGVVVDVVFDLVLVVIMFCDKFEEVGVIFCLIFEVV